jgi:C-terminal processing protease CtpA/Prc
MNRKVIFATELILILGFLTTAGWCQKITSLDRDRAQVMLKEISSDIKKHYYDPTFHGVNWDAKIEDAKQRINAADTMNRALSEVAAALDSLNDSHTFFVPPAHTDHYDYGWQAQVIGDRCFVVRVRPGSDAEKKGVKPGDELLAVNGFAPNRDNLWRIQYVFFTLRPQPALRLVLRDTAGKQRQVDVLTTVKEKKRVTNLTASGATDIWDLIREQENQERLRRAHFAELGDDVAILKFPGFYFNESEVDRMIDKARAHKALIIDLRGNPGGSVDTLGYLIAGCFEGEIKIGDRISRGKRGCAKHDGSDFFGAPTTNRSSLSPMVIPLLANSLCWWIVTRDPLPSYSPERCR